MPFDLGDMVPLSIEIRDSAGVLANAGSVALTITLPDSTTATPAVSNPSTGVYRVDYPTTVVGRHLARWVATGANASAFTDVFEVSAAAPTSVVSVAEMRAHIRSLPANTDDDEKLRMFGEAATAAVEGHVGALAARTFTDDVSGGCVLVLPRTPVISLTSVVPIYTGGTTYTVADLDVSASTGIVRHKYGQSFVGPLRVTYRAGRTAIPVEIRLAVLDLVLHWWRQSQAHGSATYGEAGGVVDFSTLPNAVLNKIRPHMPILVG